MIRVVLSALTVLFFVLLAFPVNLQSVLFSGANARPTVSLFMTWVGSQLLPPGWKLYSGGPDYRFLRFTWRRRWCWPS